MKIHLAPPQNYQGPKRSLILAGGGMRLAYQAGVLKALEEEGLTFNHADGTSGGTINLAMLFSGLSPTEMCDRWRKLDIKKFVSYLEIEKYLKPAQMVAFGDADGIVQKVFPHLGVNMHTINHAEGMCGTFNVCNYSEKTNEAITHDRLTMDYLVAGISLPIFMPPVQIGKDIYTDSVWIKDANLTEAVKRGAEEIWLVWAIGNIEQYKNGAFNQYVHMIEISANGALSLEFEYINELNARIAKGDSPYGQKKPIELYVIKPEYPLPLDPDLFFNKINTATLIDLGYADARKFIKVKSSNPFHPAVTKMKDQGIVMCFRQTMQGTINTVSYKNTLHVNLSVAIQDLEKFIASNGNGIHITAHMQLSDSGILSSTCNISAQVIQEYGKNKIKFSCQFKSGERNYFLESELSMHGKWTTFYKGIFKNMKVRLFEGDSSEGKYLGEADLYSESKQSSNTITGLYVLNEASLWKKIQSKNRFLEFISN